MEQKAQKNRIRQQQKQQQHKQDNMSTAEKQSKSKTEWHLKLHLVSHAQNNTSTAKWNIIIIIVRCKPADRIALPLLLLLVLLQLPLLCYTCRQLGSTSNSCCSFSACFVISINNDLISIVFPAILRANLKDTSMRQSRSTSPSPPQLLLLIWQIFSIHWPRRRWLSLTSSIT